MPMTPRPLTWIALLAQWMDFAKSILGKPGGDRFQQRWRESVTPIITLQAVTLALEEIDRLPVDEQHVGLDRAAVMIREQAAALARHWQGEAMPEPVLQLIDDARTAWKVAELGPAIEFILPTEDRPEAIDRFVMPDCRDLVDRLVTEAKFPGTLRLALPGTILLPGEPVGHVIGGLGWAGPATDDAGTGWAELLARIAPAEAVPATETNDEEGPLRAPWQIYRQTEDHAESPRIVRDIIVSILAEPVAGRPLLMTFAEEGERQRVFCPEADVWERQQRAMWPENATGGLEIRILTDLAERRLMPSLLDGLEEEEDDERDETPS